MTRLEFYFGGDVGAAGGVSEADWRGFLETEVTPRFPDGLSVSDLYGQWRDAMGTIGREQSKLLTVIVPDAATQSANIAAIRDAYRLRFKQESVLFVAAPVCAGF
jgi:hypothetical protein